MDAMTESTICPGCEANLALPVLPKGQTVQCPRCQRVFEPSQSTRPARPTRALEHDTDEVEVEHGPNYRLANVGPFGGERRAWAAIVALALAVLACAFQFYTQVESWRLAQMQADFRAALEEELPLAREVEAKLARVLEQRDYVEGLTAIAKPAQGMIIWPTAICFLVWLWRMSWNANRVLQAQGVRNPPGWAIGAFFVPVLNLFLPCLVLQELWQSSDPGATQNGHAWKNTRCSWVVRTWWLLCLAGLILGNVAVNIHPKFFIDGGRPGLRAARLFDQVPVEATIIWGVTNLCFLIAALEQIYLVRRITVRQRERYIRLYEDPA
jgi:hypothetical protein